MSLKAKIQEMAGETNVTDFDNLILDETQVERLSKEDKDYLEQFTLLEMISLNICRLVSLENFPTVPSLVRVELAENQIKGDQLAHLTSNKNIETLKLGNNKIGSVNELQCLSALTKLKNLDLEGNPVCDTAEYSRDSIFEMIPSLEVLDMMTKDGEEFLSDMEDGDEYGAEEAGEEELSEGEELAMLEAQLSEKQKQKLKAAGVTIQDYLAGNGPDLTDEYGDEEGEDDLDGDADGDGDHDDVDDDDDDEEESEGGYGQKRAKQ